METKKRCNKCKEFKPLSEFYNLKSAKDGKQSKCKECQAKWAAENRDKTRDYKRDYRIRHGDELKLKEREVFLKSKYGLTLDAFDQLLLEQGGVCASCGKAELGNGNWHTDHDHRCCPDKFTCGNCICGILCPRCNKGIGMFEDDPDLLLGAAAYVMRTRNDNNAALAQGNRKEEN